jgi:hypothetical protein
MVAKRDGEPTVFSWYVVNLTDGASAPGHEHHATGRISDARAHLRHVGEALLEAKT